MYRISTEICFEAAHWLELGGQREARHDHAWRVRVQVEAEELDEGGLVMDFHELRGLLADAVEPLAEAGCLNDVGDLTGGNPSTELVARYVYDRLAGQLPRGRRLREVTVWETADCEATYEQGEQ